MSGFAQAHARRALVTGASAGIGAATARGLAQAGYRVALLARREAELRALACTLPNAADHLVLPADVRDEAALARAFAQVSATFGALDLVVNNAGVGARARIEQTDAALLELVFGTNVFGPWLVCKHALPCLKAGARPVLVQVSSVVAAHGLPGQAPYSASKAALSSLSESLRLEWAEFGIRVCDLRPGLTATSFFAAQANPSRLPAPDLRRADSAEHVARHVLELDRHPQAERWLNGKWRWLGFLGRLAPGSADRIVERRLAGSWRHAAEPSSGS